MALQGDEHPLAGRKVTKLLTAAGLELPPRHIENGLLLADLLTGELGSGCPVVASLGGREGDHVSVIVKGSPSHFLVLSTYWYVHDQRLLLNYLQGLLINELT
jgi:hypothetical protein